MNQKILFSPVGGTDPISASNCRDGSMLHICRRYRPDKVILYMSYEILENQKADDRYFYCLRRLDELQGRQPEYKVIECSELREVQEFDHFYQDFRDRIAEIYREMDKTDELLLNISSGTPAMKSALLVCGTLGEFPFKLIQVRTPEKRMNENSHRDYDVETLWELNEDNAPDFENRCQEVHCPTLSAIKNEEIIKKHIGVYDYSAAATVARSMPERYTESYLELLEMARRRLLLDFKGVDRILEKKGFDCIPVKGENERKEFEYALTLEIKRKRGEYGDFIRAITPLIVDLFEMVLKNWCNVRVDDYYSDTSKSRRWDKMKLQGSDVLDVLNQRFDKFECKFVQSIHLLTLIETYSKEKELIGAARALRQVEEKIRNLAAHEIVSITDEVIKQKTKFTAKEIMRQVKIMFDHTGIGIKPEYWDSYEDMNQKLLELMERSGSGIDRQK